MPVDALRVAEELVHAASFSGSREEGTSAQEVETLVCCVEAWPKIESRKTEKGVARFVQTLALECVGGVGKADSSAGLCDSVAVRQPVVMRFCRCDSAQRVVWIFHCEQILLGP
mmetsp:Transcript_9734/g.27133  ORF Transcript_9734/g.27133 Transcript_9734/m.27133 type:complete len:114 (-) Transcript_9734:469-810(-)